MTSRLPCLAGRVVMRPAETNERNNRCVRASASPGRTKPLVGSSRGASTRAAVKVRSAMDGKDNFRRGGAAGMDGLVGPRTPLVLRVVRGRDLDADPMPRF